MRREQNDPYAPPPRHRERSGAVVRFAIIAALLGAAAWGYLEYSSQPQTALLPPEEQSVADTGYDLTPSDSAASEGTPAETPAPAPEPPA